MTTPTKWNDSIKNVKKQITSMELKMHQLINNNIKPNENNNNLILELDSLKQNMNQLEMGITDLEDVLHSENSQDKAKAHMVIRYKEKLVEFEKQVFKIENKIMSQSNRDELFKNVTKLNQSENEERNQDEAAYFLNERNQLENSYAMTDSTLNQAYAIRAELRDQGTIIQNSNSRVSSLTGTLPGIHGIINRISLRRRRDSIILASVCALGLFFLWFTVLS